MSRLSTARPPGDVVITLLGLFVLALGVRLVAAAQLSFPATEAAAYYAGVARHVVAGDGLVSDAVWSFATPPLSAPKPAFELWMPLSSIVSAVAMTLLGPTYWAAQVGGAVLGACVAPLAWAVARAAARAGGLEPRRVGAVALATGLLTAVTAPFVLNSVVPDSYMPFTVATLASALLVPMALGVPPRPHDAERAPGAWAALALGVCLGLAYLSRQEAVWTGLVVLVLIVLRARMAGPGRRLRNTVALSWPIIAGGLIVVIPWLLRNAMELGSPFPGQAIENLFLRRNEDIFAFSERPSAALYFGQGAATILGNPIAAAWAALVEVLLVAAFPVGLVGLVSLLGLRRSPALRHPTSLQVLLLGGGLTFGATALLVPIASRWGTYLHASGPLLVALTAAAALGADALVARISRWRGWPKANVIIGPAALIVVSVAIGVLQLDLLTGQTRRLAERYASVAEGLDRVVSQVGPEAPRVLMTDHPMWLSTVTGRPTIALPEEDPASLQALGRTFDTSWLVVVDERGRYPAELLSGPGSSCLAHEPLALGDVGEPAWLFRLARLCRG